MSEPSKPSKPRRPAFPLGKDEYLSIPVASRRSLSDGPYVEMVQEALGVEVTGHFNATTREAVMDLQRKRKIDVTGVVDEATWKKLPR